jgi:membrane protein DedA with SNARE-associated domain
LESIVNFLENLVTTSTQTGTPHIWAYFALMLLVIIEGPISILLAAGLTASGILQPGPVFWSATLGNLIADFGWYGLGYTGFTDRLAERFKFLKVNMGTVNRLTGLIQEHALKLLLFAKITNGLIVPVLIATGMARVSMRRWFPVIFVTNLATSLVFVFIGYTMATSLRQIETGFGQIAIVASLLLFLAGIVSIRRVLSRHDLVSDLEHDADSGKNQ